MYTIRERIEDLSNVWFMTPSDLKIQAAKNIGILENHIIKYEYNIKELKMPKFDVVIGNPPYHLGADKLFYMKFLKKSYESIKDNGIILYITPTSVYTNNQKFYQENKNKFAYINLDPSIGEKYFSGIGLGTPFTYFLIKKDKNDSKVIIDYGNMSRKVDINALKYSILDPRNFDEQFDNIMKNIYQYGIKTYYGGEGSVTTKPSRPGTFKHKKDTEYKYPAYLSSKEDRRTVFSRNPGAGYGIPKLVVSGILEPKRAERFSEFSVNKGVGRYSVYFPCKNEEEAKNIQKFFNSEIYEYIDKKNRYGRYASLKIPDIDFSKTWTNEELYKHLKLTQYKEHIKSIIKPIENNDRTRTQTQTSS